MKKVPNAGTLPIHTNTKFENIERNYNNDQVWYVEGDENMKSINNDDNKLTISAVHHERGGIKNVKFDNGRTVSIQEAISMAKDDRINDVNVGRARDGRETLRSNPSAGRENFLSNKPEF